MGWCVRAGGPDEALTLDLMTDRLTMEHDEAGRVTWCRIGWLTGPPTTLLPQRQAANRSA